MKKVLIILGCAVAVLAIVAYFVVFSPGTYDLASSNTVSPSGTLSLGQLASGQTGTISTNVAPGDASGTASSSNAFVQGNADEGIFASEYSYPYIVNWADADGNSFSITGASLESGLLTLAL